MCSAVIRVVCKTCGNQTGKTQVQEVECYAPIIRPAWGSGVANLQQHRSKRRTKLIGMCDDCRGLEKGELDDAESAERSKEDGCTQAKLGDAPKDAN